MSRTELDAATLAKALRRMAGDGSVEWVTGPIQASVLLDVADLMDDNAKLRELVRDMWLIDHQPCKYHHRCNGCNGYGSDCDCEYWDRMRELGVEVDA